MENKDAPTLNDWKTAGKIAAEALQYGKSLIKKGAKILEVSDKIEEFIKSKDAVPAFPSQISCNEIAAHYCAHPNDELVFEDQLCCLDVGVCYNGAIGDNALTVDLSNSHSDIVKAAQDALGAAIKEVQIGTPLNQIGRAIHDAIVSHNLSPIRNLSGHGLGTFDIHTTPTIPNYDNGNTQTLEKGQFIAIEPFATNGAGIIYESSPNTLYMLVKKKPVRSIITRSILKDIEQFNGLPFTTRWLTKKHHEGKVSFALKEMLNMEMIKDFPPLVDKKKGMVAQAEHSLLVDDKVQILTKNSED
ncbi:MAG: type II methionyl aminopeptidase [Candidatus Woesearchaeota archaeon]|jgi:methionyl aminopeptidase|nr:type II methionyl aminopeptidase [Candidatus Woesearchaeota archaeon]MDP7323312.1 type II methionyl aminopeptidase [Candidatus Woesearchaeota archaeon]MDP7457821.1 type II methionyl aminopeptidase [Candidatus Woesearchaeota archaeon]